MCPSCRPLASSPTCTQARSSELHVLRACRAIRIGSVTVGALDASRTAAGLSADTPTGQRIDFAAPGTIGTILVKGITGSSQFMINNSAIGGWFIGKITFAAPSTGSGIIEGHTGTVINAPVDALGHSLWNLIA